MAISQMLAALNSTSFAGSFKTDIANAGICPG